MEENNAIEVRNVSKTFKLPHEKQNSIKGMFVSFFRGNRSYEKQRVLKNISFEIKKGEFFGIVGRNGSGKSTLLKLLAGIYTPGTGSLEINGKLTPFIELGVGFNPELTGRENVFLNGALLGFNRKEMLAMYDEIVEFAELEKFMDQKLKNYSSGMQVRLAFSIAIRVKTDIMLIDEVLAVGDEAFQRKCFRFFRETKLSDRTVVFVSHDMTAVRDYCDRAVLIHDGEIMRKGDPREIAEEYSRLNLQGIEKDLSKPRTDTISSGTGEADITSIKTINPAGKAKNTFKPSDKINVEIVVEALDNLTSLAAGVVIENNERKPIFATNTPTLKRNIPDLKKGKKMRLVFQVDNIFTDGDYYISCGISNSNSNTPYARLEKAHNFYIGGWEMKASITHPNCTVEIEQLK